MASHSRAARFYVGLMGLLGIVTLLSGLSEWRSTDFRFFFYLLGAAASSNLKVRLPGVTGTMSVNFTFILLALLELSLSETLLVAAAGGLAQTIWGAKSRPRAEQIVFNMANIVLASAAAWQTFHARWLEQLDGSLSVRLAVATAVFYAINTVSVSGIIALTEQKAVWQVWSQSFLWTALHYLVGAAIAGVIHLQNRFLGWQTSVLTLPAVYLVYRSFDLYLSRLEEEKRHAAELADLHWRTIEALALAIEAKDDTTHDHLKRVHVYATEIGKELRLSDSELQAVQAAALLHDIGKLAVPEYIISKPGKLTPEEFEKMKIHPVVGAEILERVRFPYPVAPIVRCHHEKWDGTGYPAGLKGEEIPIGARILSAVDCLDALASDRQYRRALPIDQAMEIVRAESGKAFDPKVVEILTRRYQELEVQARATPSEPARLSTNARIELGEAPAAGFENAVGKQSQAPQGDYLAAIAAARQEFQLLHEVSSELGNSLSLEETLSVLAMRLKRLVPHDAIAIYVVEGERLRPAYVNGEDFRLFSSLEIPLGQGLSGWVADNRKPIVNGNPSVEPGYLNDPKKFSKLRSALAVPLESLDGVVGVLTLYALEADFFSSDHLRILLAIASKVGQTITNALAFHKVAASAVTDELTGLPNARSLFLHLDAELARCARENRPLAVMVVDLDGFKQVNDRFGHLAGNKVLQLVGERLRSACREYDYVARMGGDEFVLILPGITLDAVEARKASLREIAAQACQEVCGERLVTLSAGVAFYPQEGANAEQLLEQADRQMYREKNANRKQQTVEVVALAG